MIKNFCKFSVRWATQAAAELAIKTTLSNDTLRGAAWNMAKPHVERAAREYGQSLIDNSD